MQNISNKYPILSESDPDSDKIFLTWPHKNCIFETSQDSAGTKSKEIFLNKATQRPEIENLLSPKTFSGFKRYTKDGVSEVAEFTGKDNLIIKGNNLPILSSLASIEAFSGKIKMIYIDPPYNTGNGGFNYNDTHNHSAWLTFMENRLSIAHKLLSDTGIIFISCDDEEFAYLKVLCDEIFGMENFITSLIWRKKAGGANDSADIAVEHEYILTYRKKLNGIYKIPLNPEALKNYKFSDDKEKTHGKYLLKDLNDKSLSDSPGLHYDIICPDGSALKADEHQWKCNYSTFMKRLKDDRIVFKKVKGKYKVYYKIYLNEEKGKLKYDAGGNIVQKGRNMSSILYDVALNKEGARDLKLMFDNEYPFAYPKPVKLIKALVRVATKEGDTVLDFFAGSGTTGQAVMEINHETKLNRNFILIEQLDCIEEITVKRNANYIKKNHSDESLIFFATEEGEITEKDKYLNGLFYSLK